MNGWRMSGLGKFNVSLFYGFAYQSTVNGRTLGWCTPPNAEPELEREGDTCMAVEGELSIPFVGNYFNISVPGMVHKILI